MKPVIELKDIFKVYKLGEVEIPALRDVSLTVNKGEFVAIMGPSGSGKTTLMNILGLLDRPTYGKYLLNSERTDEKSERERAYLRNQKIGFVFQVFNLLPRMSALRNVMMPFAYGRNNISRRERKSHALKLLEQVGLKERVDHKPNELSGGERQRVAIARAIINDPSIILADEPTGTLDTKTGKGIMEVLKKLNKQGRTIVMVTHDEEMAKYAKRFVRLKDGKVIE
jgi:putative ABC transport system ATP-binding protein